MDYTKRLNEAIQLKRSRRMDASLPLFQQLLTEHPFDPYLLSNLSHLYFLLGDYKSAIEIIERTCQITTPNDFILTLKADTLWKLGRLSDAEDIFKKMLSTGFNLKILIKLIKCYIQQEKFELALIQIDRGLGIIQNDTELLKHKGEILFKMRQYEDAAQCYSQIIQHNPKDEFAYLRLIMAKLKNKTKDDVIRELTQILNIPSKTTNSYLHTLLARAYVEIGQYDEAVNEYQKALRLKPDYLFCKKQLGFCYAKIKNYDAVIQTLRECLMNDPDDVYVKASLLSAYRKTNRLVEAKELLLELISRYPQNKKLIGELKKLR